MQDVMVDLETMGTGATAAIVAIGACFFNPQTGEIGEKFEATIDLQSALDAGLTVTGSTVEWWLKQSDEARGALRGEAHINIALQGFSAFLAGSLAYPDENEVRLWGNGAAFDNAKLSNAYDACRLVQPWKFWNDRCYRTVKAMRPDIEVRRHGEHHNALDDAVTQALHMAAIMAGGYK